MQNKISTIKRCTVALNSFYNDTWNLLSTCFVGYKFNAELHKQSSTLEDQTEETKACQDVDECAENNGDCQQVLNYRHCQIHWELNEQGSFRLIVSLYSTLPAVT